MPPRSFVHAAPTTLPTISGPFCTSSSRAGATSGNATSKRAVTNLDELRQVTLTNLYHNGTLKGTSEGKQMEVRPFMQGLNDKVALWRGDITTLKTDAILNAANRQLLGGGGIDGAIHRTAGPSLAEYCSQLPIIRQGKNYGKPYPVRLEAGQSIATPAFKLPCRKVIHTVGPDLKRPLRMANLPATKEEMKEQLRGCYATALRTCVDEGLRSVALCAVSVGVFMYPLQEATEIALTAVRDFFDGSDGDKIDLVVLVVFEQAVVDSYADMVPRFFPPDSAVDTEDDKS